jgi:hypothetical protein
VFALAETNKPSALDPEVRLTDSHSGREETDHDA